MTRSRLCGQEMRHQALFTFNTVIIMGYYSILTTLSLLVVPLFAYSSSSGDGQRLSEAPQQPLQLTGVGKGISVKSGTQLRILPVGDSITMGFEDPVDGGYRLELLNDLSG